MDRNPRKPFMFFKLLALVTLLFLGGCGGGQPTVYTPPQYSKGSVVAVWNLEDMSIITNPTLAEMSDFLTAKVTDTLKERGEYQIVEREKLLLALEELQLGSSELTAEHSRLQVGQIVGAQLMVFGGFQILGEQMRIDLRMVEVETGAVIRTATRTSSAADVSGWLKTAEEAATELL